MSERGAQRGETVYITHQEGWIVRQIIQHEIERIEGSLPTSRVERATLAALRHLQTKLLWSETDGCQLSGRDTHTDSRPF